MASQLRVDKIVPVDGVPTGGGGGIIQVVQTIKKDQFTTSSSVSSGGYVDLTGLSATITPKFNTSKILVDARLYLGAGTSGGTSTAKLNLVRGSTNIGQPSGDVAHEATIHSWSSAAYMSSVAMNFLDSPATTSATTYKLQAHAPYSSTYIIGINNSPTQDNYTYMNMCVSTITAMEISA